MDLRVQKTYMALIESFTVLLESKDFDEISVTEICDGALIRRQTFYKHFLDKYDFMTFFIKRRINGIFEKAFRDVDVDKQNFFSLIFEQLIRELDDVILLIFKLQMNNEIMAELVNVQEYGKAMLRTFGEEDADPKFSEYKRYIMMGITINSVYWYKNHKNEINYEEIIRFHKTLLKSLE